MTPHSQTFANPPSLRDLSAVIIFFLGIVLCGDSARAAALDAHPNKAAPLGLAESFGVKPPGDSPEIFAPGVVSRPDRFEARLAFSRDLQECYLTETDATFSHPKMLMARHEKNGWGAFAPVPFAAKLKVCQEPFISSDNQRLYFTADGDESVPGNTRDLWFVQREGSSWGEPSRLPAPINSPATEFYFNQSADGTIVFSSDRAGGQGSFDLYYIQNDENGVARANNFGPTVNSAGPEFDPCISPDGRFIIFASARDGARNLDLYVSYRNKDKSWSTPARLPGEIDTPANEYGATFSPDGRYLFFVRHDGKQSDIYWVATTQFSK